MFLSFPPINEIVYLSYSSYINKLIMNNKIVLNLLISYFESNTDLSIY